jgi:hypothetical protein
MEYKTEFERSSQPKEVAFKQLESGDLFRWIGHPIPAIALSCLVWAPLSTGCPNEADAIADDLVLRIRIDRVEDGLPVFVDA